MLELWGTQGVMSPPVRDVIGTAPLLTASNPTAPAPSHRQTRIIRMMGVLDNERGFPFLGCAGAPWQVYIASA